MAAGLDFPLTGEVSLGIQATTFHGFSIKEATIDDLQLAFEHNQLTSRQLVQFYLGEISRLNTFLKAVIEVNPDVLDLADKADYERKTKAPSATLSKLHGIPILVKDNIATKDKLNTTAGSYALFGSVVPRDAGVVTKLRNAGAVILGKASLSEWSNWRSNSAPSGWSARGGQGVNPYNIEVTPSGSSSGSAIAVAANLAAVALGTETDGSILSPSSFNSVVGMKPTVGLTSRAGVVPISSRQDSVGPICRTVSDAAYVLDVITGIDNNDIATTEALRYIPDGGYAQFLKLDGLQGKRLGILSDLYDFKNNTFLTQTFEQHVNTLRKGGAVLVDNLKMAHFDEVKFSASGEDAVLSFEFKVSLNKYLNDLVDSPVRSLADVIAFNKKNSKLEKINEYGQKLFEASEKTNGIGGKEQKLLSKLARLSRDGFEKFMTDNRLDALVTYSSSASSILAIGGFPGIVVPAGFHDTENYAFGICFGGLKGSEPKLIEVAHAFENATKIRKPPPLDQLISSTATPTPPNQLESSISTITAATEKLSLAAQEHPKGSLLQETSQMK